MRGDANEGPRRCGHCGQTMYCESVVAHHRGLLPTGTTYHHACTGCGERARTVSTWKAILDLGSLSMVTAMLGGLGVIQVHHLVARLVAGAPVPGPMWGLAVGPLVGSVAFSAVGLYLAMGVINRRRHPLLP